MKKSIIRALILILMLIIQIGGFAYDFEYEGLRYNIISHSENKVQVTYLYEDNKNRFYATGDLEIPKYVEHGNSTYMVTSIGKYAFWECSYLKSVIIPNSVNTIADDAFHHCVSLTSVSIPNSVTSIGWSAFANCTSLTSVSIPSSVKILGPSVFEGCYSLETVLLSNSITSIGTKAFANCCRLTSLTIPSTVTSIGEQAFNGCLSLKSINIPDELTSLSRGLFGCCGLTSIIIPKSVTSIGASAFGGCSSLTSVTIPNSVTSIGKSAFGACSGLTSVTIPNSVASIGEGAFTHCHRLNNIEVEYGNPNYSSFDGILYNKNASTLICCPAGKETVSIPSTVKSITRAAFLGCSNLISLTIPKSVTSFEDGSLVMFSGCSQLKQINVDPDNISFASFDGSLYNKELTELICCPNGKVSVEIPKTLKNFYSYQFNNCFLLENISVDPENPNFLSFDGALYNKKATSLEYCPIGKTSVTLPKTLTFLWLGDFEDCSRLENIYVESANTEFSSIDGVLYNKDASTLLCCPGGKASLSIPHSVTSINDYALRCCPNLESFSVDPGNNVYSAIDGILYSKDSSILIRCPGGKAVVTIPDLPISVSEYAFYKCNGLTSLTIPPSVVVSEIWRLDGCINLRSINYMHQNPDGHVPSYSLTDESSADYFFHRCKLYVPVGTLAEYRRSYSWSAFHHIEEMDFGGIEDAEMDTADRTDEPVIRVENGVIKVDNADGEAPVEVFDISGKSVFRECANIVSGLAKGIYIVKVGVKVQKIRL